MSNLTISVDDALIKRARVRAIQQGTSLSAKVREFLLQYVSEADPDLQKQREEATARLMATLDAATALAAHGDAQAAPPAPRAGARVARRSLRDELYKGDFRDRDREAATTTPARRRKTA